MNAPHSAPPGDDPSADGSSADGVSEPEHGPREAAPDTRDAGARLVHLLRALTVRFDLLGSEFAAANGLHPTDLRALICLLDADRSGVVATPGLLGERLGLNSASVTGLVDRLERLGLVTRARDSHDRRRVRLRIEERAVTLGWGFFGPLIGAITTVAAAFDTAELATVERFLGAVRAAVEPSAPRRGPTTPRA